MKNALILTWGYIVAVVFYMPMLVLANAKMNARTRCYRAALVTTWVAGSALTLSLFYPDPAPASFLAVYAALAFGIPVAAWVTDHRYVL